MKQIIFNIARFIGITTCYHVSSRCQIPAGEQFMDGIYTIRPWLASNNLGDLRLVIKKESGQEKIPTIVSITKIG